jgi:hypothetical protein
MTRVLHFMHVYGGWNEIVGEIEKGETLPHIHVDHPFTRSFGSGVYRLERNSNDRSARVLKENSGRVRGTKYADIGFTGTSNKLRKLTLQRPRIRLKHSLSIPCLSLIFYPRVLPFSLTLLTFIGF